jgi:hypothetical protein
MVFVAAVAGCGSLSTVRHDQAHQQRVASIEAEYRAEHRRQIAHYVTLIAAIEDRRNALVAVAPDGAPVSRVDDRDELAPCRTRCSDGLADPFGPPPRAALPGCAIEVCRAAYVEALTRTYFAADLAWARPHLIDLESLLAHSHNATLGREIDEQLASIQQLKTQALSYVELVRQLAIQDSQRQRDVERGARRARVRAAAEHGAPRPW